MCSQRLRPVRAFATDNAMQSQPLTQIRSNFVNITWGAFEHRFDLVYYPCFNDFATNMPRWQI